MKRQVSEKTLELNIAAELLGAIRGLPNCGGAFWIGMKQDQEAKLGIDELIHNVPHGYHLALQFKSPKPTPKDATPYRFTINDRQNNNLLRLAQSRPDAVYYVLPHYNTLSRIRASSPWLVGDTWSIRVYDLNGLSPSSRNDGSHTVDSYGGSARVNSQPFDVKTTEIKALLGDILREPDYFPRKLFDHKALKDWIETTYVEAKRNPYVVGHLFRGFSTICL
jgi:hypothetical protein